MTTVHITNAYHPTSGGIRTAYNALIDEGNRAGRRVVLIVPGPSAATEDIGPFGRIYHLPAAPAPAFDRRYRVIRPHQYFPGPTGRALVSILEREQASLVEICDKYSLPYLAAMLRKGWHRRVRRPVLVGLSAERFDDNMAAYLSGGAVARSFTRWYIRHLYGPPFDVHVANSEYTAGELRAALWDRPEGFIRVCPPGVDVAAFNARRRNASLRATLLARAGGTPRSGGRPPRRVSGCRRKLSGVGGPTRNDAHPQQRTGGSILLPQPLLQGAERGPLRAGDGRAGFHR